MEHVMRDGLRLSDAFIADCGCVFGTATPGQHGMPDSAEGIFACVPCSLLCPTYAYFTQEARRQGKQPQVQVRD